MLIEINIGLLGAVAIIASLTGAFFDTKYANRWIAYAIAFFGLSGVLSTVVLFDSIRSDLLNQTMDQTLMANFSYVSIFAFLIGTEILIVMTFSKYWKVGKVTKRG